MSELKARMNNVVMIFPEALKALQQLNQISEQGGVPHSTLGLLHLRASQINGCSFCVDMHPKMMLKAGETHDRLFAVSAWRESPHFNDAERAALALTESLTRIADSPEGVPDAVWNEAARHYDEKALAALVLSISQINVWNRLNVATRQLAGANWM